MKKQKIKFEVYWIGTGYGCYAKDYCREFLGETWAVSEAQAINNIRHRTGFPRYDFLGDAYDEGHVDFELKAFVA